VAYFNGYVKLRRMRPGVSWEITRSKREPDDGTDASQPMREPLDPNGSSGIQLDVAPPLMGEFCSKPLPPVQRQTLTDGWVKDVLPGGAVGDAGRVDCFTGEVLREIGSRYRTEHDWLWYASATMRTPCEVLILDEFVHEDLFGPIRPELHVYSDLPDAPRLPITQRAADRIPAFEPVQHLGKGLSGIRTPDVPRYLEMVRYTFERLGWDPTRFDVYRVRMEYPPVPTMVTMESPLAEPPA
jgi:hypothetical protein